MNEQTVDRLKASLNCLKRRIKTAQVRNWDRESAQACVDQGLFIDAHYPQMLSGIAEMQGAWCRKLRWPTILNLLIWGFDRWPHSKPGKRTDNCWNCKRLVDSTDELCCVCGWFICPHCDPSLWPCGCGGIHHFTDEVLCWADVVEGTKLPSGDEVPAASK
jgi:hypothetical protein